MESLPSHPFCNYAQTGQVKFSELNTQSKHATQTITRLQFKAKLIVAAASAGWHVQASLELGLEHGIRGNNRAFRR